MIERMTGADNGLYDDAKRQFTEYVSAHEHVCAEQQRHAREQQQHLEQHL
jgi:hypothetical protein